MQAAKPKLGVVRGARGGLGVSVAPQRAVGSNRKLAGNTPLTRLPATQGALGSPPRVLGSPPRDRRSPPSAAYEEGGTAWGQEDEGVQGEECDTWYAMWLPVAAVEG